MLNNLPEKTREKSLIREFRLYLLLSGLDVTVKILDTHPSIDYIPLDFRPPFFEALAFIDMRLKQFLCGRVIRAIVDVAAYACPVEGFPVAHGAKVGIVKDLACRPDNATLVAGVGEVSIIDMLPLSKVVQQMIVSYIKASPPV